MEFKSASNSNKFRFFLFLFIFLVLMLVILFEIKLSKTSNEINLVNSISAELLNLKNLDNNTINITIKRTSGDFEVSKIIFIIKDETNSENITVNYSIALGEEKSFTIKLEKINISKIKNISIIFIPESNEDSSNGENNEIPIIIHSGEDDSGNSGSGNSCVASCSSLGYECGIQTICGSNINCGSCTSGYNCSSGKCNIIPSPNWSTESITKTTLWETTNYGMNPDDIETPLTTFNGTTYFVWIDSDFRPEIGMISNGTVTTEYLDKNETDIFNITNDGHLLFSIGVDKDGYIHVTGNMHHYFNTTTDKVIPRYQGNDILYWVSNQSQNISQFDFMGNNSAREIPGHGFTYLYFVTDNNGELYARARTWVVTIVNVGSHPGILGWSLWRYNTTNKSWTALGDLPPQDEYDMSYPAIFWENGGIDVSGKGWYQGFSGDMKFDSNNRMHVVTTIASAPSVTQNTHLVYAYSDDGGETFYKADGTKIESLPIRVVNGSNQGDIIADNTTYFYQNTPKIAFDANNNPIIQVTREYENRTVDGLTYWYWDPASVSWKGPYYSLLNSTMTGQLVTGSDGILNMINEDYPALLYRTSGARNVGYSSVISTGIAESFDVAAARDEGVLKFMSVENSTLKIVELNFSSIEDNSDSSWQDGITSWWNFDKDGIDPYGNVYANVSNATHISSGCKEDGCYSFDGNGQGIRINKTNSGEPLTISFWFKANSVNVAWAIPFYWPGIVVQRYSTTNYMEFVISTVLGNQKPGTFYIDNCFDGHWCHFIASFNETHVTQSVNGVFGGETYYTTTYNYTGGINHTIDLYLGRTSSGNYFNGSVDDLIIWNRTLTKAEMAEVYQYYE